MGILRRKKKPVKKQWGSIRIVTCDSGFEVRAEDWSTYRPITGTKSYTWAFEEFEGVIMKLLELRDEGLRIET